MKTACGRGILHPARIEVFDLPGKFLAECQITGYHTIQTIEFLYMRRKQTQLDGIFDLGFLFHQYIVERLGDHPVTESCKI